MSTKRRAYVRIVAGLFLIGLSLARAPKAVAAGLPADSIGPAVLDDWGNRFASLGASVPENALRTQIRTTERPTTRPFDVHPDGDRFVVSGDLANTPSVNKVVLVPNFFDELRRRLSDASR
jgi:hypothetical protein